MNLRNLVKLVASLAVCFGSLNTNAVQAKQALALDGLDDLARESIAAVSPSGLDLTTFTVEGWIFPTQSGTMFLFSDSAYTFQLDGSSSPTQGVRLTLYSPGPGGFYTFFQDGAGFTPTLNQWNHVAAGYDAVSNQCFMAVNGHVDLRTGCASAALDTAFDQLFGIGTHYAGSSVGDPAIATTLFKGRILGVRYSNTLRYTTNFTPSCPRLDAATVALWEFGEPAGATSFADLSAAARTLSGLSGAATVSTGLPGCGGDIGSDFDGDGKSDIGIYRDGVWSIIRSSDSGNTVVGLGGPTWTPVPADYDGDGKTDTAVYLNGTWVIMRSSDSQTVVTGAGGPAFIPVPADYDGDDKADIAVYSDGAWSIIRSSDSGNTVVAHGGPGWTPVPADYDGDGKTDIAVYINGAWSIIRSSDSGNTVAGHGGPTWTPVPADYDGDGKTDIAVYINGAWSIIRSSDSGNTVAGHGGPTWTPVPADYDGDGKTDIAAYLTGAWSIKRSSDNGITVVGHGGAPQDIPLN